MIHPLPEIHTEEDSDEEEENSESDYPPAYWDKIIGYIHADYKVFEVRPVGDDEKFRAWGWLKGCFDCGYRYRQLIPRLCPKLQTTVLRCR